ncbi:IS4 family transposase [Paenibacillus sp. PAMC21692]|uniref:IS4 family transposase n=1 Tax=Paenibacillus sp. PAMC21692 TaxID=2762320 RepID=UPI00164EC5FA|nr:IS4 family transposase [Paenibacillus sp. PAMC21692]QNK56829.1 IS4 family transposase [Paenibacillus sp. PAMC21692]QNK57404.1 IS4 family transposase [Paenibacillus sp. PAMC21692]QNK57608.1 IS4 family transposase [Paenibacillus sp. PAMC21692]QNK57671.1 IS4 family transposase [Paenibacillus sp. PAMC21692]
MSVSDKQVVRQCLSLLPLQDFVAPFLDYRKQFKTVQLLKLFITGQLLNWDSLRTIESAIRSDEGFQAEFQVKSISKSQLSRRMNSLPVEITQALFAAVVHALREPIKPSLKGKKPVLAIVDSTSLRMPPVLGDWAYVTEKQNSVKVHTRLVFIDEHTAYPDHIVPSTGNISDFSGSDDLVVVDPNVLYVMDRGYVCYVRMEKWVTNKIDFVIRLANHHYAEVQSERPSTGERSTIVRDAVVILGNQPKTKMRTPLRLIEFYDDQGRFYRIATTRHDLPAEELMDVYRNRWLIELFFKWLKQHLKFAKLYSYQPDAVWNHIYLALVGYGLSYLVKRELHTTHSTWDILRLIRLYATKRWSAFLTEVHRIPKACKVTKRKTGPPKLREATETPGVRVQQPKKRNR